MRALLAIVLYGLAAAGGLAAGYYATAPGAAAARPRAEQRLSHRHTPERELAEMEAASRFLEQEERRAAAGTARRASADL
jgi:hypothetical protein